MPSVEREKKKKKKEKGKLGRKGKARREDAECGGARVEGRILGCRQIDLIDDLFNAIIWIYLYNIQIHLSIDLSIHLSITILLYLIDECMRSQHQRLGMRRPRLNPQRVG